MRIENIIKPSQTELATHIVSVPKEGGIIRVCVDYCKLNAVTMRDVYQILHMNKYIESLDGASVFSVSDDMKGNWELEIDNVDKDKAAFTCHNGMY